MARSVCPGVKGSVPTLVRLAGVDDAVLALGAWAEAHESPYDALRKGLGRR